MSNVKKKNKKSTARKTESLGMSYGSARNKLTRMLLFKMVVDTGQDICFQCGENIEDVRSLSIEHKEPWLGEDDAVDMFFDLENVTFSHLSCNSAAARRPHKIYESPQASNRAYKKRRWLKKTPEERKLDRRTRYLRSKELAEARI